MKKGKKEMKIIDIDLSKDEDEMEKLLDTFTEFLKEKNTDLDGILKKLELAKTPRKKAQVEKRKKLIEEMEELEDKLEEVTSNDYVEIGEFMNEYLEKEIELQKELYKKCKNWLDDNGKPYKN